MQWKRRRIQLVVVGALLAAMPMIALGQGLALDNEALEWIIEVRQFDNRVARLLGDVQVAAGNQPGGEVTASDPRFSSTIRELQFTSIELRSTYFDGLGERLLDKFDRDRSSRNQAILRAASANQSLLRETSRFLEGLSDGMSYKEVMDVSSQLELWRGIGDLWAARYYD